MGVDSDFNKLIRRDIGACAWPRYRHCRLPRAERQKPVVGRLELGATTLRRRCAYSQAQFEDKIVIPRAGLECGTTYILHCSISGLVDLKSPKQAQKLNKGTHLQRLDDSKHGG